MITREDVADLRAGDVVELTWTDNPDSAVTGKVWQDKDGCLRLGVTVLRRWDGNPWMGSRRTFTVVSRAARPLYVNSDRTEPVPGDVARDADSSERWPLWVRQSTQWGRLRLENSIIWRSDPELPDRLRLLVDGTTGLPPAVTS